MRREKQFPIFPIVQSKKETSEIISKSSPIKDKMNSLNVSPLSAFKKAS